MVKGKAPDKDSGFIRLRFDNPPHLLPSNASGASVILGELTQDHRRVVEKSVPIALPASPEQISWSNAWTETAYWELGSQDFMGQGLMDMDGEMLSGDEEGLGEQIPEIEIGLNVYDPLNELMLAAPTLLNEMSRCDGRGDSDGKCRTCRASGDAIFRCVSCSDDFLSCKECIVRRHHHRPLDRVEFWNGSFFERKQLKDLGLFFQLGHHASEPCGCFRRCRARFVVVDIDYIQEVDVRFCQCQRTQVVGEPYQQLLRKSLFPATVADPHTAFTFRALSYFHALTLTGKVTMYDFYRAVERRTDGSGLQGSRERYDDFVRVMRMWRYLKMLKRGGVAATPGVDLKDVKPGDLAIRCPACPRPEVNLPKDWIERIALDPSKAYLYFKFISVDACFRLKRRGASSEQKDPGLLTGSAYYVEQPEYQQLMAEMRKRPPQEEEGHCLGSGLKAIAEANTKFSKGYTQTGCILCLCTRHKMVEPNGAVDMNKGER
ncbi:hypothetical protein V5O48_018720, partial [Marasmius crinis-equi]